MLTQLGVAQQETEAHPFGVDVLALEMEVVQQDVLRIKEGELREVLIDSIAKALSIYLGMRYLEAHLAQVSFTALYLEAVDVSLE